MMVTTPIKVLLVPPFKEYSGFGFRILNVNVALERAFK